MNSVTLRLAGLGDAPVLLDMMEDFNACEGILWDRGVFETALRRLLADASLGFVLVADAASGASGYTVVTFNYDLEFAGRDAFVTELYVLPAARRAGVARGLLAAAEARAVAEGACALHLLVLPENGPARSLYHAAGFEASPRVLMSKRISSMR